MWDFEWDYGLSQSNAPWAAFSASIRRLVVDQGVTSIGNEAFDPCEKLEDITLPDTLVRIGEYAFQNAAVTEIRFPASLTTIEIGAFYECANLTDVYFDGTMAQWKQVLIGEDNNALRLGVTHCTDGDMDNRFCCGDNLTWAFDEATGTLTVSGTGDMWSFYTSSAPWEGLQDQIRKVVLEPGVTKVGQSAFWGCHNLTEIVLPEGLTYLGQFCFRDCPGLVTVDLPASLEIMEQGAFSECPNLVSINAAEGGNYKTVDGVLFSADQKTLVIYPGGLGGENGVYQVPDGVTKLGDRAFYNCEKLTEIILPDSVVEFGGNEFQRCYNLESVNIPYGVDTLYVSTFYSTKLKSITIPASVTAIWEYAFADCGELKTIVFEGSAPEIAWLNHAGAVFLDVTATAYYPADDPSWTEEVRQSYGGAITWVPYTGQPRPNPFADVKPKHYLYDAVLWAYYHDPRITGGTGDGTTFSPNVTCTREQAATFLWAAAGSPEPTTASSPFADVKAKHYFCKPVLWAVENGITGGVGNSKFGVGMPCTRTQIVTFLYKALEG